MSATTPPTESDLFSVTHLNIPTCGYCGHFCNPKRTVKESFCSHYCYYAHKGEKALNRIRSDHRWCATCFRAVKDIERPPEGESVHVEPPELAGHVPGDTDGDVLIGYQYRTEHTVWGVDDFGTDAVPTLKRQRWSCECGNVDPAERDDILERVDLGATIHRCYQCLRDCHASGALDDSPDKDRFEAALQREGADFPYAIGYALHGA